ncbi:hypothetical protein JG687_00005952 [Phytophthora cactorum]|uniref:Uncharacterized protein n=1 Tax=Phytophthora cactorum TaxID=29920 RepID=A0A8T1ULN4_9STRA|nr:hypothetical protein JG687_00005952 [Phytophthora cactorum]
MYAGAQWSSDVSNATVPKKTTESAQTDISVAPDAETPDEMKIPLSEILKKSRESGNSQRNPEVSSVEIGTQAGSEISDVGSQTTIDTRNRNVQATPKTTEVGIETELPTMVDSFTTTDEKVFDEETIEAINWIKKLYKKNPNWASLKVKPIKTNGSIDTKRYIGKRGNLYKYANNKRSESKFIDWVATRREIENILYSGESNSIDEVDAMRGEDKDQRYSNFWKKRPADSQIHSERKLPAVAIWEHDSSSDTMMDEKRAKAAVKMMISVYSKKFKGFNITVIPVLKDGTELKEAEVFIDTKGLLNIKNHTGKPLPAKLRELSWLLTLQRLMDIIETKGVTIEFKPEETNTLAANPSRFQPTTGFWLKGKSTGDYNDINLPTTSMAESDAKTIILDYFHAAHHEVNVFPIHLTPVKLDGTVDKLGRYFYWFKNDKKGIDELRMMTQLGDISSPKNSKDFFKKIDWTKTLEKLLDSFEYLEKNHKYMDVSTKPELKGRGLRGAGVAPLEGVVRRGRTYNLNEIQGLATPSAYVYRQLGSKYIRIPDLDNKNLVIVQPNRRKCGPKRQIGEGLQSMIRTLAFKQHIDQAAYDKLSIDDKKLFKEILAITHLQYNFHDRLEDPLESLKAEYDKLKGELELGNDNPSIIKQLKSLSVDMYSNRLISDSEFKDIIVRLI